MKLKLIEKRQETSEVVSLIFELQEPLVWEAGQYLHYVLHHRPTDDRGSDRWFTNAAAPFENHVRITTRITSDKGSSFKKKLISVEIGKSIEISHVEGDFVVKDPDKQYVFIAGGIGITPFRSIIKELEHEKKAINITLLYANKDKEIVYKDELEEIASKNPNFKIHYIFSPDRVDQDKIISLVPDYKTPVFYISGPEPMVDSLGNMLKDMGTPQSHIMQDWFPGYASE